MPDASKQTVLVVDDEEIIREFLKEVLNDDYQVTTASDGDEAINFLRTGSFDLVITDLKMPRVSGEEVVREARQTCPTAPVIVMSGYSSLYTVSQSVNHGANAFLSKPFSISQLLQTIDNCLESGEATDA
jgi:DNA-binding NtrC family response regulator